MPNIVRQVTGRAAVLRVYKQLLMQASRLPQAESAAAVSAIREGFRSHAGENEEQVGTLLQEAQSRLSFIKMVTPRHSRVEQSAPKKVLYMDDGKAVEGSQGHRRSRAAHSNWSGSNLDPDSVKTHQRSLDRAGFGSHAQVHGPQGF
jgi:hypothetical protein